MSKAVLISIQPKWCELIANGRKTIEVRKTRPSIETPFKCYIYCTKHSEKLIEVMKDGDDCYGTTYHGEPIFVKAYKDFTPYFVGRGQKVIGEFVCDRIDTYNYGNMDYPTPAFDGDESVCEVGKGYWITVDELEATCLTYAELENYGKGKTLYGWHISDLVIYDNPRELGEFKTPPCEKPDTFCHKCKYFEVHNTPEYYETDCWGENGVVLTRPPQSWCYVEEV